MCCVGFSDSLILTEDRVLPESLGSIHDISRHENTLEGRSDIGVNDKRYTYYDAWNNQFYALPDKKDVDRIDHNVYHTRTVTHETSKDGRNYSSIEREYAKFKEYGPDEYDYYDDIGNDNYENKAPVNDPRYYIDGKEYVKYGQPTPQRPSTDYKYNPRGQRPSSKKSYNRSRYNRNSNSYRNNYKPGKYSYQDDYNRSSNNYPEQNRQYGDVNSIDDILGNKNSNYYRYNYNSNDIQDYNNSYNNNYSKNNRYSSDYRNSYRDTNTRYSSNYDKNSYKDNYDRNSYEDRKTYNYDDTNNYNYEQSNAYKYKEEDRTYDPGNLYYYAPNLNEVREKSPQRFVYNLPRTLTIQHAMNDKEIGYDEYALVKPYDYYAPVYSHRDSDSQYSRYDSKEYDDRTSTQTPNRRNFATRVDRDRQEQDGPESGLRRGHKVLRAPGIANGVSGLVQLMTALPLLGMMMFGKKKRKRRSVENDNSDQNNHIDYLANQVNNHIQQFQQKIQNWNDT